MLDLSQKHCVPCEGGEKPLTREEFQQYVSIIPDWEVIDDLKIKKKFTFKDFKMALAFVNKVGDIAEEEGHHPNINLYGWNKVSITLTTHAIGGLSLNDFIMAAKIDRFHL